MSAWKGSIAHVVVTDNFAGVEKYVVSTASHQASHGATVTVVGGNPDLMRLHLSESVTYVPGPTVGSSMRALLHLGRLDIVHSHMTSADFVAVSTRPITRAAVVSTRHFAGPRGARSTTRMAAQLVKRGISSEIAISDFVARSDDGKAVTILNGVPIRPRGGAHREQIVMVMQRLETEKDTETALRAFALSGLEGVGWSLHIVGQGSELPHLQRASSRLGIAGAVIWHGFVSDPENIRSRASIHLATAQAEPFGLAVVESMAIGLPVIASAGGAHRELLGPTDYCFEVGDAAGAATLLRQLADNPAAAMGFGALLRERQQRYFALPDHVSLLDELYRTVSERC